MKRKWFSMMSLMLFVASSGCVASTGDIPFTPSGIASLPGKDICALKGEFYIKAGVSLDGNWEHSIEYRARDGVTAVFLLGKSGPPTYCGTVDSVLDLTPLIKKNEAPYFKCSVKGEAPATWGHIVGIANNHKGRDRFVTARLAWRVDIGRKRFQELHGKVVRCDTSGYKD